MRTLKRQFLHTGPSLCILCFALAFTPILLQPPIYSQPTLAATRKLSAITAVTTTAELKDARIADDYIIYQANYDEEQRYDLYSAPLGGGEVTRLTANLPLGTIEAYDVAVGQVVFAFRSDVNNRRYLYSIPAAGGALTLLGPQYSDDPPRWVGSQLVFGIAGERVVFSVDAQVPNGFELYSVPAVGGPATRLSPELPPVAVTFPAPFWVTMFAIDDGLGLHVALNVQQGPVPEGSGLYAVPADGSVPPMRIGDAVDTQFHDRFDLTPDGQYVVYMRGDELHTVRFTGGDDTLIDTGAGSRLTFAITADSARIVYAQNTWTSTTIKSAPIGGGAPLIVADNVHSSTPTFYLTPDGAGVLYNNADLTGLFIAPVIGGPGQAVFNASGWGVSFSADGAYVVFIAGEDATRGLYSYAMPNGPVVRIDDPATSLGGMLDFEGALTADRALYAASNATAPDTYRLYSVSFAGGAATMLTDDLGDGQELIRLQAVASDQALFISGTRMNGPTRWHWLYAVPADGSAEARLVDMPRTIAGDVVDFAVSPVDGRAVYLADQERDGVQELYSVPLAGGTPTKLNAAGQWVASFKVSPTGGWVAYLAGAEGAAPGTLSTVPITGGPATAFSPDLSGTRADYQFTPDGASIVFGGDSVRSLLVSPIASPLYSASVTGGQAMLVARHATRFEVDPNSVRVAFVVDAGVGDLSEVQTAPLTGGRSVPLGTTSVKNALTGPLLFTGDGARVIFQTGGFMGTDALVSLPVTGGEPVTLVEAANLLDNAMLQLNADGSAILYGGQFPQNPASLFATFRIQRIPVIGGAAVTLTEQTLPIDMGMPELHFTQAPGGGPVVFGISRRDGNNGVQQFLASVPESGGAPVTLYGPGPHIRAPLLFAVRDDGSQVLFPGQDGLYNVPSAGGDPEQIRAGAMFGGFGFAEDGSVLFIEGGTLVEIWPYAAQFIGGTLFHVPQGGAPIQLYELPVGIIGKRFVQAGQSVVFPAVAGSIDNDPASGTTEIYAADISLAPPAVGFTTLETSVVEDAGPARIEVHLSRTASITTTVGFSVTGGTALEGLDYTLGAGPLTFAPGETVHLLPLTIHDRPLYSGNRTLVITLGAPTLAAAPAMSTITITILDDEVGLFLPLVRP